MSLAACLRAADARFPALSAAPELLQLLDAFLERAARAQTQREPLDRKEQEALSADAPHVLLLFLRAAALLPESGDSDDGDIDANAQMLLAAPLHAARVVPFCQVFARSNAAAVAHLLDALAPHAERFGVRALQRVFHSHLHALHALVQQDKRTQVLEAIHSIYEVALSLSGLLVSEAFAPLLLESGVDVELAFRSDTLLRALVVCYEADLPTLQRHLVKLDDAAQAKLAIIAETRQLLLQTLGCFMDLLLTKQEDGNHDEVLLEVLHTMSHCCDDEDADQGSYLSDLWYLCEYKHKISSFLESGETDSEHLSYLEMIVDALPRRRIVSPGLDLSDEKPPSKSDSEAQARGHDASQTDYASSDAEEKRVPPAETSDAAAMVNSLVLQVKDFFPDLGEGYIELCLLSSANQLETVINFLLESNPPPALLDVPQNLSRSDPEFAVVEAKLSGKAPPQAATTTKPEAEKLDPSRVWIGKKPQEKTYDPQVAKRDTALAEKTKKIAKMIEEEEELMAGVTPFLKLDEYDDDYNDEFEDYEPFGVKDSGQGDDQDSIRLQNRVMRAREAEDAFWESMRNVNHLHPVNSGEAIDEDAEKKLLPNEARAATRRPAPGSQSKQQGSAPAGSGGEQKKKSGQQVGGKKTGQGAPTGANVGGATTSPATTTGAGAGAPAMTKEQELRARARSSKNKAKVANHHRKERALKKQG